ncbi:MULTISPECIES: SMI1/KNR4 family protein [Bacillus]|uniref:SMI1/KNR4 family protein n=1 Tax=Bacillus pseudomycoides TaxID=64104 RepID=A0AAJ1Z2G2_9BACI|nr:SMI1/KNR4 family protein [Bacillus pseudomycoides]EEM02900.1 SMI1 / KNR4 [Bacillus pseudomycoides]EEM08406.1 SMI1 / KNR4 [Bacillus pseudomycoides]KFN13434.1 SMI1 / KNR4 family protein [Bacillus pseudomycoides]MCR8857874.1 SMI1/KNR4 family protein [Bacillus pseudomycoides]MDR4189791.1 SMI1/KNR4 family protein [Bacillus pseudomycoides]
MRIKKDSVIFPLPSEDLIFKKEEAWRVELPLDYKNFIKLHNGGLPEKNSFICNNHSYAVIRFLCILEAPEHIESGMFDIDVIWSRFDERLTDDGDLLGVALLPIAVLFAGNVLCFDFRESRNSPTVCVWDHENSVELEPVVYYVTNTFQQFLDMLH